MGPVLTIAATGYRLERPAGGLWPVISPAGRTYIVEPEAGSCTCPDYAARGQERPCKHVRAVRAIVELAPWMG
jgi:predicted nucleic acid-binding Zn finger protein